MSSPDIRRPRCAVAAAVAVLTTVGLVAVNDAAPADQAATYGALIAFLAATTPSLRRRRGRCASGVDGITGEAT